MIKKILVSQPKPSSEKSPYYDIMRKHNVELEFRPFIKVESLTPREFRAQRINILDHTAIIFSSRHAIDNFFLLCQEMRIEIPEDIKYFCITETISHYIQKYVQYRKRKVFFGTTGKIDDIIPLMVKHKNEKYFVPQSDQHTDDFANMLDAKKLNHSEAVMFRTVSNDFAKDEPFDYDMLIFFSPSGISSLMKNFPGYQQGDTAIGTFGPTTAKAAKDAGLRVDLEAPSPQFPSITAALQDYVARHNGTED
jgi:uroporphyrinogen-III synthase